MDSKTHFVSILYLTPTYEGIYALLYFLNIISCIFIFWDATTCKSTHCGVQLYMQRCCDSVCHCGGTTLLLGVLLQYYRNTHDTYAIRMALLCHCVHMDFLLLLMQCCNGVAAALRAVVHKRYHQKRQFAKLA